MSEHSTTQAVELERVPHNITENEAGISTSLTILCAATVGVVVGNLYYAQPLLPIIAQDLGLTEAQVGGAASLGMLAQTFGMFFLLPLGDVYNRRPFILASIAASVLALLAVSFSNGIVWFSVACFAVGISTFGTHMTISLAASLAHPQKRGQVVGTVFGGLLTGLLLSRTISGVLGSAWGWRPVYYFGASVLTVLFFLLYVKLPNSIPQSQMSYPRLLWSMVDLLRAQPILRLSCAYGAAAFASFNAFWVTLAFHLEQPPLEQGSDVVGMLGLLGVVGALIAGPVGKLADSYGPQRILFSSMVLTFVSFAIFGFGATSLWAISFGVIVMDLGIQATQVSNQAQIYSLIPEARNRLGTIYIVIYFLGGSIGSAVGVWAWSEFGWTGVCVSGGAFMGLALLVYLGQWIYGRGKAPIAN